MTVKVFGTASKLMKAKQIYWLPSILMRLPLSIIIEAAHLVC
jgi:hypothetical protein